MRSRLRSTWRFVIRGQLQAHKVVLWIGCLRGVRQSAGQGRVDLWKDHSNRSCHRRSKQFAWIFREHGAPFLRLQGYGVDVWGRNAGARFRRNRLKLGRDESTTRKHYTRDETSLRNQVPRIAADLVDCFSIHQLNPSTSTSPKPPRSIPSLRLILASPSRRCQSGYLAASSPPSRTLRLARLGTTQADLHSSFIAIVTCVLPSSTAARR